MVGEKGRGRERKLLGSWNLVGDVGPLDADNVQCRLSVLIWVCRISAEFFSYGGPGLWIFNTAFSFCSSNPFDLES